MPRASETVAISAKLGDFARVRTAKRRSAGNLIPTMYGRGKPIVPARLLWTYVHGSEPRAPTLPTPGPIVVRRRPVHSRNRDPVQPQVDSELRPMVHQVIEETAG